MPGGNTHFHHYYITIFVLPAIINHDGKPRQGCHFAIEGRLECRKGLLEVFLGERDKHLTLAKWLLGNGTRLVAVAKREPLPSWLLHCLYCCKGEILISASRSKTINAGTGLNLFCINASFPGP